MKEYKRTFPHFALCGLNCGLCPRYHTDCSSRCPGCGGPEFHLKHPACAVITCNLKHDSVEYCFQCSSYPCDRYAKQQPVDSFITYRNVKTDFEKARADLDRYKKELKERMRILEFLLERYNDGKRKNCYCLAANLLDLGDLKNIMERIGREIGPQSIGLKEKAGLVVAMLEDKAQRAGIELKLRK